MEKIQLVAGVLFFIGFVPYIWGVLKNKVRPNKATWMIWSSVNLLVLIAMSASNTLNGQIVGATIGSVIVALLSFRYGTATWSFTEIICVGVSILGIVAWVRTNDPEVSILLNAIVMIIGAIPTLIAAWKHPERESRVAWTLYWLSCVCTIIAIPAYTIGHVAPALGFALPDTIMMYLLFRRR